MGILPNWLTGGGRRQAVGVTTLDPREMPGRPRGLLRWIRSWSAGWLGPRLSRETDTGRQVTGEETAGGPRGAVLPEFLPYLHDVTGETAEIRAAYRLMWADAIVKPALLGQILAVCSLDLQMIPADKHKPEDRVVADFVKWVLTERLSGGLVGLVWSILSGGLPDGYSVCEKVFDYEEKGRWSGHAVLRALRPKDVINDMALQTDPFKNVVGIMGLRYNGGLEFSPSKFVIYQHLPLYCSPVGMSAFRAAYGSYWMRDTAKKLRAIFLQKNALPVLKGEYSDPTKAPALQKALASIKSQNWLAVPKDSQVEAVNIAGSAADIFASTMKDLTEEIFLAIQFATLQALTGGQGQQRGNSKVHESTADQAKWFLAQTIEHVLNDRDTGLVRDIVDLNYAVQEYPRGVLSAVDAEEQKSELEIDKGLSQMGLELSKEETYERYSRTPPEAPDDSLKPPQPGGPGAPGGLAPGGGGGSPFGAAEYDEPEEFDEDHYAEAEAEQFAAASAQYAPGHVWQGPSGKWFTKRQDGRVVPAKNPNAPAKAPTKPRGKAASAAGNPLHESIVHEFERLLKESGDRDMVSIPELRRAVAARHGAKAAGRDFDRALMDMRAGGRLHLVARSSGPLPEGSLPGMGEDFTFVRRGSDYRPATQPKAKAPAAKPPKADPAQVHARILDALGEGITPEHVEAIGRDLQGLTVPQIQQLAKQLDLKGKRGGLVRGPKPELVAAVLKRVQAQPKDAGAAVPATPPAQKPKAPPQKPAAPASAAKPSPEEAAAHVRNLLPLAAAGKVTYEDIDRTVDHLVKSFDQRTMRQVLTAAGSHVPVGSSKAAMARHLKERLHERRGRWERNESQGKIAREGQAAPTPSAAHDPDVTLAPDEEPGPTPASGHPPGSGPSTAPPREVWQKSPMEDVHTLTQVVGRLAGRHNLADLADIREALPKDWSRARQDAAIQRARGEGLLSGSGRERHLDAQGHDTGPWPQRHIDAGLRESAHSTNPLGYLSVKKGAAGQSAPRSEPAGPTPLHAPPTEPASAADVGALLGSHGRLSQRPGHENYTGLDALRREHPNWSRAKFDSVVKTARQQGKLSLRLSDRPENEEHRRAGFEGPGGEHYGYVSTPIAPAESPGAATDPALEAQRTAHAKEQKRKQAEIRRQVDIAFKTGGTVPYDLRTLIDAGVGIDRIRKVSRKKEK